MIYGFNIPRLKYEYGNNCFLTFYFKQGINNITIKMISNSTLAALAITGGIATVFFGINTLDVQKRMRKTRTYKRALEKVHNHKQIVELLGQPIREGKIIFEDNNSSNGNRRQFSVNLKGLNTKGKLNCEFTINESDKTTELKKLEVKLDNLPNKVFMIHETL